MQASRKGKAGCGSRATEFAMSRLSLFSSLIFLGSYKNVESSPMPAKGTKRDPLLDCPIVKIYREVVHLQMNYLQRKYVAENVSCCERGQRLWRATLTEWMLNGFNPKNIPGMVKLWENQFWANETARFESFEVKGNGYA